MYFKKYWLSVYQYEVNPITLINFADLYGKGKEILNDYVDALKRCADKKEEEWKCKEEVMSKESIKTMLSCYEGVKDEYYNTKEEFFERERRKIESILQRFSNEKSLPDNSSEETR